MRIAGIIAEYNPFHNGHAWHVHETRRLTGCDYVIACMDGHFTQRGEPTPFSRWSRARMALACGVDAVFELPTLFALQNAQGFARGGVALLGDLGADDLSFGSEISDIRLIERLVEIMDDEPPEISQAIRAQLSNGSSHARARGDVIADYVNLPRQALKKPNFILAMEYTRAIRRGHYALNPVAVHRQGDYHDQTLKDVASASAIRAALAQGEDVLPFLPESSRPFAKHEALHDMDDMLLWRLRQMSLSQLRDLPEVTEGLEHRIAQCARQASSRETLLNLLKCKRYPTTSLSRTLTHALLGITRGFAWDHPKPTYARLVGLRRGAEPLMKTLKDRSTLPIVTSPKRLVDDDIFQLECRATDLWSLLHDQPQLRQSGRELTEMFPHV